MSLLPVCNQYAILKEQILRQKFSLEVQYAWKNCCKINIFINSLVERICFTDLLMLFYFCLVSGKVLPSLLLLSQTFPQTSPNWKPSRVSYSSECLWSSLASNRRYRQHHTAIYRSAEGITVRDKNYNQSVQVCNRCISWITFVDASISLDLSLHGMETFWNTLCFLSWYAYKGESSGAHPALDYGKLAPQNSGAPGWRRRKKANKVMYMKPSHSYILYLYIYLQYLMILTLSVMVVSVQVSKHDHKFKY